MVFLTLAVVLLCVSFYRRYKRMQKRQELPKDDRTSE